MQYISAIKIKTCKLHYKARDEPIAYELLEWSTPQEKYCLQVNFKTIDYVDIHVCIMLENFKIVSENACKNIV